LHARLQLAAEGRNGGVSDVIREALERLLGVASHNRDEPPKTPAPTTLPTPPRHDGVDTIPTHAPGEFLTWQEFKRRRQQDPEAALPAASHPPTAE
jgi:hypothetical protein